MIFFTTFYNDTFYSYFYFFLLLWSLYLFLAPSTAPTTARPTGQCNGVPSTDWSCCSSTSPCNVGGGDCDTDSHCTAGLTCGTNNCRRDFSSTGSNWGSAADCCIGNLLMGNLAYTHEFKKKYTIGIRFE